MSNHTTPATVLGLGAMGSTLATTLIDAGHPTTVWNRSAAKAEPLVVRGATAAASAEAAVRASPVVVACLFDHASVHAVLDPIAGNLRGRSLVNLTTSTPNQARELAAWSASHGIDYLDGGIMAVPEMIGRQGSAILYSGSQTVFDAHRALLELWGESTYLGSRPGDGDRPRSDGSAMVTALMKAGHRVTVWNCTPSRAAELVRAGAALAPTPSDAVVASKLVIVSLTDYPAMYDILSGSSEVLAGKVLVNLSSDTPAASREAAAWAAEHGASFLTGGVMVGAVGAA